MEPLDVSVGDLLLVNVEEGQFAQAPSDLWPDEPWAGVVRLLTEDEVVVDIGGRLRVYDRGQRDDLREGNTVSGSELSGIGKVLSVEPVKFIDFPPLDDVTIDHFKVEPARDLAFEDFGGSQDVISRARELIEVPLEKYDKLAAIGAQPIRGVLFTGPPGTGKTMLARIIAARSGAQFYRVNGPEVLSKWYGQSEKLVRALFEDATSQESAIIFFDEIDSVANQRSDESHEASRRLVGQLLTSMDGFSSAKSRVIVIATTNRLNDIDVALRRPGRFDWEVQFTLPSQQDREHILSVTAREVRVTGDLPYSLVASRSAGWSPAELKAIWAEAALLAVQDDRDSISPEDFLGGFERVSIQHNHQLDGLKSETKD